MPSTSRTLWRTVVLLLIISEHCLSSSTPHQVCGGVIPFQQTEVVLLTPGYPGQYPPGVQCNWDIETTTSCGLQVDLGVHSLPCSSNTISVDDRPLCGPLAPTVLIPAHRPSTRLSFRGESGGGEGFNLTVRRVACDSQLTRGQCGGEYSGDTVTITSPAYPTGYPGDVNCRYMIRPSVEGVCQLVVTLQDSVLEQSINCGKDRLQINQDILCGKIDGVRTYDIGGGLHIIFTTDSEGSDKGFKLTSREVRCTDTVPDVIDGSSGNDKQDVSNDCLSQTSVGYPYFKTPNPPFPFPDKYPSRSYLPPDDSRIPLEQEPSLAPPYSQTPIGDSPSLHFQPSSDYRPQLSSRLPIHQPLSFFNYQYSPSSFYIPYQPSFNPIIQPIQSPSNLGLDQCCGRIYSESHFLIASPGFPRSEPSDCIYTIRRFSPLTYQLRLQFRYFWVGQDTGVGCSGGVLEIDGARVCGCKTGIVWTSRFVDSESEKVLHLRLDSYSNKLFDGFVIEVYQDDSYGQRYQRAVGSDVRNFTQIVETVVERGSHQPSRLLWGYSPPSTDWFCLRWTFQDWLLLAKEALWAQYQCPSSAPVVEDASRNDLTCRTCAFFCRQNCRCC